MEEIKFWKAPTMADVAAGEDKALFTHISLFSGLGGSSTGMRLAGAHTLGANEFIDYRLNIYSKNYPKCNVWDDDIRTLTGEEILRRVGLKKGELDVLDGSPPCFISGTMIKTIDGFKAIESIQDGDYVLTHKNRYMPVIKHMSKKYVGKMYSFDIRGGETIVCTPEHPFYIKRNKDSEPEWIEAKDIISTDYMSMSIDNISEIPMYNGIEYADGYNKTTKEFTISEFVNTLPLESEDFWWIVGRYLGDGWVRYFEEYALEKTRSKNRYSVKICCDKTDCGVELNEIKKRYDRLGFKYTIYEARTVYKISVGSKEFCKWILRFGRGAANKHLTKDVYNLPKNLMKSFVDGYISADGNIQPTFKRYGSISKELIYGINYCVAKCYNILPRKISKRIPKKNTHVIEGRTVNVSVSYDSGFPNDKTNQYFIDNDKFWFRPKNATIVESNCDVYNMSVSEDETYTANMITVHNCSDFSTNNMGTRESKWGHEKRYSNKTQRVDDLFYEFARVLKEIQPKVFVAENVKGLTMGNAETILGDRGKTLSSLLDIDSDEDKELKNFNGKDTTIVETLRSCGYKVSFKVLNCSEYGIPQMRERLIFIGVRNDLPFSPSFPKATTKHNKILGKDAVGNFLFNGGNIILNPETMTYDYVKRYFPPKTTKFEVIKIMEKYKFKTYAHRYHRDNWDKVFYTVVAQDGNNIIHTLVDRYWSTCEVKKIQSFPDDFDDGLSPFKRIKVSTSDLLNENFVNSIQYKWFNAGHESGDIKNIINLAGWNYYDMKDQKIFDLDIKTDFVESKEYLHSSRAWENIGRAVPPLLYKAVGEHIYNTILSKL